MEIKTKIDGKIFGVDISTTNPKKGQLFNEKDLKTMILNSFDTIKETLNEAMISLKSTSKKDLNSEVKKGLNFKKKGNVVSAEVYNTKKNELPSYHIFSRIPWLGVHDTGGVSKKVIIPNIDKSKNKRMKKQTLTNIFNFLYKEKLLNVNRKNGITYFFAIYNSSSRKVLRDFRHLLPPNYRQKKGASAKILIAFKLQQVNNKKKINFNNQTENQIEKLRIEFFKQLNNN